MKDHRSFGRLLVVELGGSVAGAYCGKLFADFGAVLALAGSTHGEPDSSEPDSNEPDPGCRSSFYGTSKNPVDDEAAAELLAKADVVIQSNAIDPISQPYEPSWPGQVVVRTSPFGLQGPYAGWRSTDLVDTAIAGHLRLSGDPTREPLQSVPDIVHHASGVVAFIGAVAALIARARIGKGQVVETSHQEVIAALHQFTLGRYTHNGAILNRMGNRYAGPGAPIGAYACADGWIGLALPQEDQMERMLEVTGLISLLDRPDIESVWDLMTKPEVLDTKLIPYLKEQNRDEIVELFQALRLPCAPVSSLQELIEYEHLQAREFWQPVEEVMHPGPPFRMSDHGWNLEPKQATLEAHTADDPHRQGCETPADLADGPLTGLRVLDMTRVWAGPLATRILADLGAEVLMSEVPWTRTAREVPDVYVHATRFFPDDEAGERPWNRSCFHNKYAVNKLSTVIDLNAEAGRGLFASLVENADVLVENYSPRVMPGFGFDQQTLHDLNPDLIYVTMPGYGRNGPHSDWVAYGPTIDGHVGHTSLTGYAGEHPWKIGIAWPDPIGGLHGAAAAVVALLDRFVEPDRGGQTVEVAQIESAINMIGQHVVRAQTEGETARLGNRRQGRAPQGVYPCAGDDRWIAISIVDDRSWRGLCQVADWPDIAELDANARWEQHDKIDARLSAMTKACHDVVLMHELQEAGVPAGAALAADEVMADCQLAELEFFVELEHADAGTHPWPRFPARLSETPATVRSAAALMGEHNRYGVCDVAGLASDDYERLLRDGVLYTEPPH